MSNQFADKELQAKLLRETYELNKRRIEIESSIEAVDAASYLRIEKEARRDIEAYKHRLRLNHSYDEALRDIEADKYLARLNRS